MSILVELIMKNKKQNGIYGITLGLVLLLAIFFRFTGVNWDQGNHLHPDERFLTMVGNAMNVPEPWWQYFDPTKSTFNPQNVGYEFFVYGSFPLTLNKILAVNMETDNYNDFTLQGRMLSAFFDCMTLLLLYAMAKVLGQKYKLPQTLPLWSAFIYAVMVLPIQLSHFFAVDTLLTTFMTASIFFSLKFAFEQKWSQALLSGISFGLAMACKINAVLVLPLLLGLMILIPAFEGKKHTEMKWLRVLSCVLLFLVGGYVSLRIADPNIFASGNWLNPRISKHFIENIQELKSWEGPDVWFPPAIQWITKLPVWFALKNMTVLGVGIMPMLLVLGGVGLSIKLIINEKGRVVWLLLLSWVGMIFLYQSTQFAKNMRYFIFLYPLLAIWAGIGASYLARKKKWIAPALILLLMVWPLMFMSIYLKPHSRVQASAWILNNIPENQVLLSELWDDGIPVNVPGLEPKVYKGEQLPVFDQDTPEKWQKMNALLEEGDYYTLTSNRGWGSITTVPWKYPTMSRFYQELLANKLPLKKVVEFTSYPSLKYLGIPLTLSDDWADESFTVYDHPKVMIFRVKQ